jgi:hypothetical protein
MPAQTCTPGRVGTTPSPLRRDQAPLRASVVVVPGLAHKVRGLLGLDGTQVLLPIPPNHENCYTRHESTCSEHES